MECKFTFHIFKQGKRHTFKLYFLLVKVKKRCWKSGSCLIIKISWNHSFVNLPKSPIVDRFSQLGAKNPGISAWRRETLAKLSCVSWMWHNQCGSGSMSRVPSTAIYNLKTNTAGKQQGYNISSTCQPWMIDQKKWPPAFFPTLTELQQMCVAWLQLQAVSFICLWQ